MGFFDIFRQKTEKSCEERLAGKICAYSSEFALLIHDNPMIVDKDRVSERGLILAIFEITFFYVHVASRTILRKFGPEVRNQTIDSILGIIEKKYMETLFKNHNEKDREILHALFCSVYNIAEANYSQCTSLYTEKTSIESRRMTGSQCTALLTYLTDRLYKEFSGEDFADDIIFISCVKTLIAKVCESKELDSIINEMKF